MDRPDLSRRRLLTLAGAAAGAAAIGPAPRAAAAERRVDPFRYALNMSTIRGQKLSLVQEIEIAAKAGYTAIEPWMGKINDYHKAGHSLKDLGKRIADLGLTVESAIGFARWIVDDDTQRAKGLEDAKRDMAALEQIGGKRIAAPPVGATKQTDLNLFKAAERYRTLIEVGAEFNVVPQVEVWGFSKSLSRLGESVFVMIEAGHPKACLLPDVYHIFKGGSRFEGLNQLSADAIPVFHVNDYPAQPPRAEMNDAHRVYPGDGVAPLDRIFRGLADNGSKAVLSLELFNRDYWQQDPLEVAKTGLAKTKAAVAKALA